MNKRNFFSFLSAALLFGSVSAMDIQNQEDSSQSSKPNTQTNSTEISNPSNEVLSYSFKSPYTQATERITQGAVLLGSRNGIIGTVSTATGYLGGNMNPNNINDANPVVLAYWKDLQKLQSSNQFFSVAMRSLQDRSIFCAWKDDDLIPFALSLNGYNVSIANSYVSLIPLDQKLSGFDGSLFYRNLNEEVAATIKYDSLLEVLSDVIGKPSENFSTIKEVFMASLDRNLEENTDRFFNSELTAYFYKKLGLIDKGVNCSNVIPAELSSFGGFRDILNNVAIKTDNVLKISTTPSYGGCCLIM